MANPADGALYERDTLAWQFNSQWLVMLGGPRAAIMQVCEPGVAAGVAEFSNYRNDTLGRLERTMDAMLAISFGSPDKRERTLRGLEKAHAPVKGKLADGSSYSADEPARQFWVLATLTDTVIEVDRRYLGRMRTADRIRYYDESKRLAGAFGVPDEFIPDDYAAFGDYMAEQCATLEPTEESRDIARTLMAPRIRYVPGLAWMPFSLVTTELLPTTLRRKLGLRDLNPVELATVRAAQVSSRNSLGHLGGVLAANPLTARALEARAA